MKRYELGKKHWNHLIDPRYHGIQAPKNDKQTETEDGRKLS